MQALVGRVYEDLDGNGMFTDADRPIANARVITSTGQAAITDPDGLYNIPSLGAGSVAVSLDRSTVPVHLTIADDGPGGRSWTRLLRTPIGGGTVLRQNFVLRAAEGRAGRRLPGLPQRRRRQRRAAGDIARPPAAAPAAPARYQSREGESLLIALGEVSFGQAAPEFEVFGRTTRPGATAACFCRARSARRRTG